MASTYAVAAAAAAGSGESIGAPQQQQMPDTGFDADLEAPAATPSIAQLMAFLVRQQTQMAEMMITFKSGGKEHLANAKLDDSSWRLRLKYKSQPNKEQTETVCVANN